LNCLEYELCSTNQLALPVNWISRETEFCNKTTTQRMKSMFRNGGVKVLTLEEVEVGSITEESDQKSGLNSPRADGQN